MPHPARTRCRPPARALLGVLGVLAAALTAAAPPVLLRGAALTREGDEARLTLDLTGPAAANVFTLGAPNRVVVDLSPAATDARALHLPAGQGFVQRVRTGPRDGHVLRVVIEVDGPVRAHAEPLVAGPAGRRLVLALAPLGKGGARPTPASLPVPATPPAVAPPASAVVATDAPVDRTPVRALRDLVIAVDAGHGGEDPGASGRDGTHEKDVTLAVARVLAARINAEPGMRAVLTRGTDVFVPLRERIRRARVAQADLFVSVHADAVPDRSVSGSSVYVLSQRGASSEAAKWLADRENAADLVGGVSLEDKDNVLASVLLDLSQSAAMSASMTAAGKVLDELNQIGEVRKARVQQAGFVVLKSPDIPSMLVESAYITNPAEEHRLRDPHYQSELADAILGGLRNYFRENPPPGTRLAALAGPEPLRLAGDEPRASRR